MQLKEIKIINNNKTRNNKTLYKYAVIKCFLIYCVIQNNLFRSRFRNSVTSKMEHFVIIFKDFQLLTIITKSFMLRVAAVLYPPLPLYKNSHFVWQYFSERRGFKNIL